MKATVQDQFFEAVYDHFSARTRSLQRIVETKYSFEEWVNWEVFLACSNAGFSKVTPRPTYRRCGAVACKSLGDILLEGGSEKVLVEIGLLHDSTGGKWLDKLEEDRKKLSQPFALGVVPVHVIICASRGNVCNDSVWTEWLKRLSFWSQPRCFERLLNLEPGTALFRAWVVPRNDCEPNKGGPANSEL
jgi:hypothetical protein